MSKELDALNDMLEYLLTYDEFNEKRHIHNASIIETALERLNYLDEHKIYRISEDYQRNLQDIKKIKALEIIKEKEVSVSDFIYACKCSAKELKEYHDCDNNYELACSCVGCRREELTPEEYGILKEVLL